MQQSVGAARPLRLLEFTDGLLKIGLADGTDVVLCDAETGRHLIVTTRQVVPHSDRWTVRRIPVALIVNKVPQAEKRRVATHLLEVAP